MLILTVCKPSVMVLDLSASYACMTGAAFLTRNVSKLEFNGSGLN